MSKMAVLYYQQTEHFPASYQNPENTTKFAGHLPEIGQSFKLDVLVRYVFLLQLYLIMLIIIIDS